MLNFNEISKRIYNFLCGILFPPRCVFCERILEPTVKICVCGKCFDGVEFCSDGETCIKCGKPIVSYGEKHKCYYCLNHSTFYFNRTVSVFNYTLLPRRALLKFKTHGYKSHTDLFVNCMALRVREEYTGIDFDFICGVLPSDLHKKKGFDCVEILCRGLSSELLVEYKKNVFKRTRKTLKQSSLNWQQRQINVKDSIGLTTPDEVLGKTVLLVDDVCTTRATLIEYSHALKKGGAKAVYAVTVATVKSPMG